MESDSRNGGATFIIACRLCLADPPTFRVESPRRMPEEWWDHMIREHPLSCERVRLRFPAYLNGLMAFHGDRRVVAHLAACGICAATLRMMERQMIRKEFGSPGRIWSESSAQKNSAAIAAAVTAGEQA